MTTHQNIADFTATLLEAEERLRAQNALDRSYVAQQWTEVERKLIADAETAVAVAEASLAQLVAARVAAREQIIRPSSELAAAESLVTMARNELLNLGARIGARANARADRVRAEEAKR